MPNKLREYLWLVYYSFVLEPFEEICYLFESIKKPKTWFYAALGIATYGAYYKKYNVIKAMLPIIIILYIIRQKIEGSYRRSLLTNDLSKNKDTEIVKQAYENYKKKCFFSNSEPLEYEQWKQREINKMNKEDPHA